MKREYAVRDKRNGKVIKVPGNNLTNALRVAGQVSNSVVVARVDTGWVEWPAEEL